MIKKEGNIVVSAVDTLQKEPDLELCVLAQRKIVRADSRYGYVGEVDSEKEAMDLIEDIEEETGVVLWWGHAVDLEESFKEGKVVEKKGKIGLWQRREQ